MFKLRLMRKSTFNHQIVLLRRFPLFGPLIMHPRAIRSVLKKNSNACYKCYKWTLLQRGNLQILGRPTGGSGSQTLTIPHEA